MLLNLLYDATITLTPKLDKDTREKKKQKKNLQANISNESGCKNPQSIIKQNSTIHRKYHIPQSCGIYSSDTRMVQHIQINVIHHINEGKDKKQMIISKVAEKSFDKFQHLFMISQKSGDRDNFSQHL